MVVTVGVGVVVVVVVVEGVVGVVDCSLQAEENSGAMAPSPI